MLMKLEISVLKHLFTKTLDLNAFGTSCEGMISKQKHGLKLVKRSCRKQRYLFYYLAYLAE